MPKITEYYGIFGTVPFIDVEVMADNRLYVDPHAIRLRKSRQAFLGHALLCLDTFSEQITESIIKGTPASLRRGEHILQLFEEPWETRLGMSRVGFRGHGGGNTVGTWIWNVLNDDVEALVRIGVLKQIEDIPLFVKGVDRDITSDITTRIIFDALVKFTAQMLVQYPEFSEDEHQIGTFTKQIWSTDALGWVDVEVTLPIADGKELLLVPEGWARPNLLMSAGRYYETSVLSFAQLELAVRNSDGKLIKTPKDRLRQQTGFGRGRSTNLTVTMRAFDKGEDLLALFKAFVLGRLEKNEPEDEAS